MDPTKADITWWQNVDFSRVFQFVEDGTGDPHDFTGSTFEMDIKAPPGSGAVVLAATLGTADIDEGKITVGWADTALAVGEYVYDLVRINSGVREPLMYGTITILQGVTQP